MLEKPKTSNGNGALTAMKNSDPAGLKTPAVDIYETADALVMLADLPGVAEQDLQVEIAGGVLTLQAAADRQGTNGGYYRRFRLSERIAGEDGDATLKDGVLTLRLPKAESAKPKRIAVKTLH
jgi:HSP20 family molecular chaperone IbpA